MRTISIFSAGFISIVVVFILIYITNNYNPINNYNIPPYENGEIAGIFFSIMFTIISVCLSYIYDTFIDIYEEERDDRLRKIIREECESK